MVNTAVLVGSTTIAGGIGAFVITNSNSNNCFNMLYVFRCYRCF